MSGEQKVTKLIIKAFNDMQCKDAKAGTNEIELQVNPQELTYNYIIDYTEGGSGARNELSCH